MATDHATPVETESVDPQVDAEAYVSPTVDFFLRLALTTLAAVAATAVMVF